MSEQFKLLPWGIWRNWFLTIKQLNGPELLVCYAQHPNMTELWQKRFYAPYVHLGVLHAGTMADVNGELEHGETIALQVLAKKGISLLVALCLRRQVEEN